MGTEVISRGKSAVVKVKILPSALIKNSWISASNPPICHHGVERDNFTCTTLLYRLSSMFYINELVMKIVITYAEFLPFLFRNLTSKYSSYVGKISIKID